MRNLFVRILFLSLFILGIHPGVSPSFVLAQKPARSSAQSADMSRETREPSADDDVSDEETDEDWEERPSASLNVRFENDGTDTANITFFASSLKTTDTGTIREALKETFGPTLTILRERNTSDYVSLNARATGVLQRHFFSVSGAFNVQSLVRPLQTDGVDFLTISITHPRHRVSTCSAGTPQIISKSVFYFLSQRTDDTTPIHLSFGYLRDESLKVLGFAFFWLTFPIWLTLGWRFRLARRKTDAAPLFHRFFRYQFIALLVAWLGWWCFLGWFDLGAFIGFVFRLSERWMAWGVLGVYFVPLETVEITCRLLAENMYRKWLGSTWQLREIFSLELMRRASTLLPWLFGIFGWMSFISGDRAMTLVWATGAYVTYKITRFLLGMMSAVRSVELEDGDLYHCILDLARRAGVAVRGIFVVSSRRERLINAFAVDNNIVMFSEDLVRRLNPRQVNAVAAHEIGHLKHRHGTTLGNLSLFFLTLPALLIFGTYLAPGVAQFRPFLLPAVMLIGWLLIRFISRKFEFAADAEAARLTNDPEAVISSLAEITRLNLMPFGSGPVEEQTSTHPSLLRRADAIAALAGISKHRTTELLEDTVGDTIRYELPPALSGPQRLFDQFFKHDTLYRVVVFSSLTRMLSAMVAAVPFILFANSTPGLIGAVVGGVTLMIATRLLLNNRLGLAGYRQLWESLARRLEEEGISVTSEKRIFVGLSPGELPRLYDHHSEWDVGYWFIADDTVRYVGEQTRFQLHRSQIVSIHHPSSWLDWHQSEHIYITWRDEEGGGTFSVKPQGVKSLAEAARAARQLHADLQSWLAKSDRNPKPESAPSDRPELPDNQGTLPKAPTISQAIVKYIGFHLLTVFFLASLIDRLFLLESKTFIGVAAALTLWDFVFDQILARMNYNIRTRLFPDLKEKAEAVTVGPDFRS